jgi:hypothetical protein
VSFCSISGTRTGTTTAGDLDWEGSGARLAADQAKGVADLVATTDGIIFHLWGHDEKVPTGNVIIGQSVGHVNLTARPAQGGNAREETVVRGLGIGVGA